MDEDDISLLAFAIPGILPAPPNSCEIDGLLPAVLMDGDLFTLADTNAIVRRTLECCISGDVECRDVNGDTAAWSALLTGGVSDFKAQLTTEDATELNARARSREAFCISPRTEVTNFWFSLARTPSRCDSMAL
jgi:hypothetical protein